VLQFACSFGGCGWVGGGGLLSCVGVWWCSGVVVCVCVCVCDGVGGGWGGGGGGFVGCFSSGLVAF
jgi:hypothetical protein